MLRETVDRLASHAQRAYAACPAPDVVAVLDARIPELRHLRGLTQNPAYHHLDAWDHTLTVALEVAAKGGSPRVVLAARLHDVAKGLPGVRTINPKTNQPQDLGHEEIGAPIARRVALRLGFSEPDAGYIAALVRYHMIRHAPRPGRAARMLAKMAADLPDKATLIQFVHDLFLLMWADAVGFAPEHRARREQELALLWPAYQKALTLPYYPYEVSGDLEKVRAKLLNRI